MAGPLVYDATDQDFEATVLERSKQVPVVVDFWAPWCGPCRTLGPALERMAEEHDGAFLLAKVNVDQNPGLAQAFGIRSIPMVVGVRDGQIVADFVGALPDSALREFISRLLPTQADEAVAEGQLLLSSGKTAEAEASFRYALELETRHGGGLIGLATILAERSEADEALSLLDRVDPGPSRPEADRLAAQIRVRQAGGADEQALREKIAADPDDLESRLTLAQTCAAHQRYDEALAEYLEIVKRNREFRDDAGRKAMLDVFALLGPEHPLTGQYRSELAKELFR